MNQLTSPPVLGGIIAFLITLVLTMAWKLRATDKGSLEVQLCLLRSDITEGQKSITEWLRRVEDRLNACQNEQRQCPMKYVSQLTLNSFMGEIREWHKGIETERREAWRRQEETNKRQEILNLALYKMLEDHTHSFSGGVVGKSQGIVRILDK